MTVKSFIGAGLACSLLLGCGEKDVRLIGDRLDIRPDIAELAAFENEARALSIPAAVSNADWTHRGGSASHMIGHPALGTALTQVFSTNIGAGDARRIRITADPVVAAGRVFTLDATSKVSATSSAGAPLWSVDVKPASDGARDGSGGGVATDGEAVYVTTGFGNLVALDAATGDILWDQDIDAPGSSAPTVYGDLIYVLGRDSRGWAIEKTSGRVRWSIDGVPSVANFAGGAGPAVNDELAVFPMPTGEVVGAFRQGGLRRWAAVISGQRTGRAAATVSDISGDPVLDGNRIYVGNFSGRAVALDSGSGDRIWTATEGATSPMLPVGDSVFLVNDLNQLVRLDANDGSAIWRVNMSGFAENRPPRQRTFYAHYGPILAGGRLIVASSDGAIRQFDPVSGALLGEIAIQGGAASNPVVAGGTLYVVSKRGQLVAYR